ncbi:MAG TPA: type II secretion system F family protein, partial [Desulfobaccales bacterium]
MAVMDWLIFIAVFVTGTSLVYGVLHYANSRRVLKARFKKAPAVGMPLYRQSEDSLKRRFLDWVSSFGKFAMTDSENTARLRSTLIMAGFRHPKGTSIFFGIKALAAVLLPLPVLLANIMNGHLTSGQMTVCLVLAGAGFYLPQYILQYITRKRQDRIDRALPDVLDLLIVCVEAGLSLQATLNRVTEEVRNISVDMHNELHLTNAELRTGITREAALKNLGERTGVQNVKALVGMMIQS